MARMSKRLATALVRAWMADEKRTWLTGEDYEEFKVVGNGACLLSPTRAMLASNARYASDLCWDKRYNSAVKWLVQHGLEQSVSRQCRQYRKEAIGDAARVNAETKIKRNAVGDLFASHKRSNQWNVCK